MFCAWTVVTGNHHPIKVSSCLEVLLVGPTHTTLKPQGRVLGPCCHGAKLKSIFNLLSNIKADYVLALGSWLLASPNYTYITCYNVSYFLPLTSSTCTIQVMVMTIIHSFSRNTNCRPDCLLPLGPSHSRCALTLLLGLRISADHPLEDAAQNFKKERKKGNISRKSLQIRKASNGDKSKKSPFKITPL